MNAIKADVAEADEAILRELRSSQANTAVWPSDDDVRARLETGELYGYVGQPRVRMLLEACELDVRDPAKTEAIALPAGFRSSMPYLRHGRSTGPSQMGTIQTSSAMIATPTSIGSETSRS